MSTRQFDIYVRRQDPPERRRYALVFWVSLLILLALCIFAATRLSDFRKVPINFGALGQNNLVIQHGLTREQLSSMKLGYIEHYPPPRVGLFGNHQFQYFTESAFSDTPADNFFFNFWYANMSLTELRDYLRYLEHLGKLPTQTLLIQATTPNNDNGQYILGYSTSLATDLVGFGGKARPEAPFLDRVGQRFVAVKLYLGRVFNYPTVIFGLSNAVTGRSRIIDLETCGYKRASEKQRFRLSRLPMLIRHILGAAGLGEFYCERDLWSQAFRRDGSHDSRFVRGYARRNENSLDPHKAALTASDVKKLAAILAELHDIGTRNGIKTVLIVPPVFETKRWSPSDQAFDAALALTPQLTVVDHRSQRGRREFFVNYDHPRLTYFRFLAMELKRRGLIRDWEAPAHGK